MHNNEPQPLDLHLTPAERDQLTDMWTRRGLQSHEGELQVRMSRDHGEAIAAGGRIVLKLGARHDEGNHQ